MWRKGDVDLFRVAVAVSVRRQVNFNLQQNDDTSAGHFHVKLQDAIVIPVASDPSIWKPYLRPAREDRVSSGRVCLHRAKPRAAMERVVRLLGVLGLCIVLCQAHRERATTAVRSDTCYPDAHATGWLPRRWSPIRRRMRAVSRA